MKLFIKCQELSEVGLGQLHAKMVNLVLLKKQITFLTQIYCHVSDTQFMSDRDLSLFKLSARSRVTSVILSVPPMSWTAKSPEAKNKYETGFLNLKIDYLTQSYSYCHPSHRIQIVFYQSLNCWNAASYVDFHQNLTKWNFKSLCTLTKIVSIHLMCLLMLGPQSHTSGSLKFHLVRRDSRSKELHI